MSVVIAIEEGDLSVSNLRWPLRIAKLRNADITVLVCAPKNVGETGKQIELSAPAEQPEYERGVGERVRSALDDYLGTEQWTTERPEAGDAAADAGTDSEGGRLLVAVRIVAPENLIEEAVRLTPRLRVGPGALCRGR